MEDKCASMQETTLYRLITFTEKETEKKRA